MPITKRQMSTYLTAVVTISVLFALTSYFTLDINSRNFKDEFYSQNFKSIESGDSFSLIPQLNGLINQDRVRCVQAFHKGTVFFSSHMSCHPQFLSKLIEIQSQNKNIKITLEYSLGREISWSMTSVFLLTVFFSFALLRLLFKVQEIESQHLKNFNNLALRVSHDIRSPLSALQILSKVPDLNTPESRDLLNKSSKRIGAIAQDLLEKFKTAEERNLKIQETDLKKLVLDLIQEKKLEYRDDKYIYLDFYFPEGPLFTQIDRSELTRILSNLINNSVESKISGNPLHITIKSQKLDGWIELVLSDNGAGMPRNLLRKIGKTQISSKSQGIGIGAYHAFQMLKKMGGKISYHSIDGKGTTVTIKVPVSLT